MSIRIEVNDMIAVGTGDCVMEDVTVYVSTHKEALDLDTSRYMMGSILFIIEEGRSFMLDRDGQSGVWRDVSDGTVLERGGDL